MVNVANLLKLKQVRDDLQRLGWVAPQPPAFKPSEIGVSQGFFELEAGTAHKPRSWIEDRWAEGLLESDFCFTGNMHPPIRPDYKR